MSIPSLPRLAAAIRHNLLIMPNLHCMKIFPPMPPHVGGIIPIMPICFHRVQPPLSPPSPEIRDGPSQPQPEPAGQPAAAANALPDVSAPPVGPPSAVQRPELLPPSAHLRRILRGTFPWAALWLSSSVPHIPHHNAGGVFCQTKFDLLCLFGLVIISRSAIT